MPAVLLERQDGLAIITLNNPDQYNALGPDVIGQLGETTSAAMADARVRAILLTGAGKGFCSGAQFGGDTFSAGGDIGDRMRAQLHPVLERLRNGGKPVVAAVNGAAAGAGVGLALAADIVIAARSARFILSFARLGAVLDGGTSLFLQRAIGAPRARALALLAEPLPAETAAAWGLIWQCVDDDALAATAMGVARRLAAGPPLSMAMIRTQLDAAWTAPLAETLELEADLQSRAFLTEDLREGAAAFVEKRQPVFQGR